MFHFLTSFDSEQRACKEIVRQSSVLRDPLAESIRPYFFSRCPVDEIQSQGRNLSPIGRYAFPNRLEIVEPA